MAHVPGELRGTDARTEVHHFRGYASEEIPYGVDRYTNEATRLYGMMDTRLSEVDYFVGNDYSIVDMAIYPWVASHERQGQRMEDFGRPVVFRPRSAPLRSRLGSATDR